MIRFENVLKRSLQDLLKTSSKRLENVLKTSSKRLEDVLKTPRRRLLKMYELGEYIRLDQDVLKTSSEDEDERRLQDAFIKTNVCWSGP